MAETPTQTDYDAVVVGAGFGGIFMLYKLREELGLSVRLYDKASGVGGTWYWNRYPGAMSDSYADVYCYSFDKELLQDWGIPHRYVKQPQVLKYLEHVAERHDLYKDIQFDTGMTGAEFDEQRNVWTVRFDDGTEVTARYLVTALGLLSHRNIPAFPGLGSFAGETYHTGAWPQGVELAGKRVGIIGTGSTGVQVITEIAPIVGHLTVFQRSPQYTVPAGNRPMSDEEQAEIKGNYDAIWERARKSIIAFDVPESDVPAMSVSAEERRRIFQDAWDKGNAFRFSFGTFSDILVDPQANEETCEFVRSKIAEIVTDPETARKLSPRDLYAKRPLCDSGYYQQYNRDNVKLVHVGETPIEEIVPSGIRTADGVTHEFDVLIYATGFDAIDGSYKVLDLKGRGGLTMQEHWADGPTSFMGVATNAFPNMFIIMGPNGPFTNLPPAIEVQGEWISDVIARAERDGATTVEVTRDAEDGWTRICEDIANATLLPQSNAWFFGANIPGKPHAITFYLGGMVGYCDVLDEIVDDGYRGLEFRTPATTG
ncbi:MAG TPA: NAD(P)/FAD-dependent oxidoreductase [Pseudonocardia sp.]